jgi:short-subunit dehydrogenase
MGSLAYYVAAERIDATQETSSNLTTLRSAMRVSTRCAIGDLSTDAGAAAVHAEARAALGANIEILVNNAGGSSTGNSSRAPI